MTQIFFTGCTHFGHANIIDLAQRPFMTIEEMDEKLIENWNATVGPNDKVYHLGDFAWNNWQAYRSRLNGVLTLIQGNHDGKRVPKDWEMRPYLELGLGALGTEHLTGLVLFHYPIEEWNDWYWPGVLHLHCHTHQTVRWTAPRRFNVTVEANGYRPVSLDELETLAREEGFL